MEQYVTQAKSLGKRTSVPKSLSAFPTLAVSLRREIAL